ncbi:endonuclease/exonuclease/phosphatase family protein [Ilumatobacter sp.]|uniref:endonuclease/exonuclease/phosphatase family protein n=1 Tax=Ilumatobacter sp. TaxID=1967498 RepID=UPI003C695142
METGGGEWTVLTWNIQGAKPTDLGRIAEVIRGSSPDVVVLQEARRSHSDGLASALTMSSKWHEKHHPWRPFLTDRAEGATILSPHTLIDPDHDRVSDAESMRTFRRRIVQWGVVERPDGSRCRVFNVHLSPHDLAEQRRTEAERITAIAGRFGDGTPTVVAGDFNDHGTSEIVDLLPGIEALPPPPTNPSERPTDHLDHVLVPATATDVSVSAPAGGDEWAELSDHLPLTVRFSLG